MAKTAIENHQLVAVFAFPYGTHAAPLLNLVIKLAHAAPKASFFFFCIENTNRTLFSKFPEIPENIKLYGASDGIPENYQLGNAHPEERLNLYLQAGPQNLQKALDLAVTERKQRVTCIMSDAFLTSSLSIAQELRVPWVALWTSNSFALSAHFYTELIRQNCAKDRNLGFIPGFSKMRIEDLPEMVILGEEEEEESVFSRMLASMGRALPQAKAVVMNFYEELDPPILVQDLRSKMQTLIYAGFLNLSLPLPPLPPSDTDETGSLSWLDKHTAKSVAYISFGTVVTPPPQELSAMAEALEESGVPFLWSLRDNFKCLLPNGFLQRTTMKGKVVPWAPQTQILAHDSVGVFVTHGGCNSVSESVSNAVPMICRPYFGDQKLAARMMEDVWEIGVKIEGGLFTKKALVKSLNLILVEREGKTMREKTQALKKIVLEAAGPNGSAAQQFRNLVEIIMSSS